MRESRLVRVPASVFHNYEFTSFHAAIVALKLRIQIAGVFFKSRDLLPLPHDRDGERYDRDQQADPQ
jgi:hypothetical protein